MTTTAPPTRRTRALLTAALPAPGAPRLLALSWLVKTVGSGLYLTTSTLFFTRVVGLPVHQVATGLTVAGIAALAGAVPLGKLADRYGPRRTYTALLAVQFATMAALIFARTFPAFAALILVFLLAEQGSTAARGALVATAGEGAERVRLRAYLRVVTNIGITLGAAASALVIQADSKTGYMVLLGCTALTYPAAALPLRGLRAREPGPAEKPSSHPGAGWQVLRDRRYAAITLICGVLSLQAQVLSFAVPLWVLEHTEAPRVLVPAMVTVNTVMVICLQIRFSRGAEDNARAAAMCRAAGLALLAACALVSFTAGLSGWQAGTLLLLFAAALTLGELWLSAGSFGLSFNLAPDDMHGQYQGFFSLGRGAATALAPALIATLCLGDHPRAGWLVLGALFAAAGAAAPLALRVRGTSGQAPFI
ncbi:MFS transporter [Streptomyces sp. NBRC 14336]|uniref:MFS transporter n=1 Tax=Streptomyces sp. NBRC 14336 TaxID=3030992 RepID=UPI0024A108DB|nr:MFS transporter [Streptomyces sp. NBRC 14336]WBO79459.1 MFS transporter [Streptomyces sp. SBE_14.2]GLW49047.1 MFS transporter [Streptomyces sp. NBRC 14336]